MASLFYKLLLVSNFGYVPAFKYVDFRSSFNFTDNDDPFDFGQLRSPPAMAFKIPSSSHETGSPKNLADPTTVVDSTAKNGKLSEKANKLKFENDNDSRLLPTEIEKLSRKFFLTKLLHFSNVNGTDVYGLDSQMVNIVGEDTIFNSTTTGPSAELITTNTLRVTTVTQRKFIRFWSRNLKTTTQSKSTPLPLIRPSRTIFPSVKATPNRIKGKPLIMCMPDGIMFSAQTHYDFYGLVYTRNLNTTNKDQCSYDVDDGQKQINVTFLYEQCGVPLSSVKAGDANYLLDIVVEFRQENSTQNFIMKCVSQQLHYTTVPSLPVESATPELNMTLSKINAWAAMPACQMRVVQEDEDSQHGHHHNSAQGYEPSNGTTVKNAYIGQMLRMEFSLNPPSMIQDQDYSQESYSCSVDINILGHPHYDTYQDLALVHWHAFRIPEDATLSFQCECVICADIKDDNDQNGCEIIPTPPICPEIVTSPQLQQFNLMKQNQVDEKTTIESFVHKKRSVRETAVRTSICLSDQEGCALNFTGSTDPHNNEYFAHYCFSPLLLTSVFSLNLLLFLVTSITNAVLSMCKTGANSMSPKMSRKSSSKRREYDIIVAPDNFVPKNEQCEIESNNRN